MKELNEKVQELTLKLNKMYYSWSRVSAAMWSPEEWAQEKARAEDIKNELRKLVPLRIAELEEEYNTLDNRYSKFMKLRFKIFGRPKVVGYDQERMQDITHEIQELQTYIN